MSDVAEADQSLQDLNEGQFAWVIIPNGLADEFERRLHHNAHFLSLAEQSPIDEDIS